MQPSLPSATLIFSPSLAIELEDERRLPGHCIGTRRVRAGSKLVLDILKSEQRARREAHRATLAPNIDDHEFTRNTLIPNSEGEITPQDTTTTTITRRNTVTFKVMGDNGFERRMTVQEKKQYKKLMKRSQTIGDSGTMDVVFPSNGTVEADKNGGTAQESLISIKAPRIITRRVYL